LIVVDQEDGVVHEEYWGEFDADRTSLIASSGKMIAAGVLMSLDDQGILDVDAPVADVAMWGQATRRSHRRSCYRTARGSSVW
jgi:CubicO group peptidase (beta-lactamase class C family)